jgi:hypothetical protein
MYVCILDATGQVLVHRNVKSTPEVFLETVAPYRDDLVVAAESPSRYSRCSPHSTSHRATGALDCFSAASQKSLVPVHYQSCPRLTPATRPTRSSRSLRSPHTICSSRRASRPRQSRFLTLGSNCFTLAVQDTNLRNVGVLVRQELPDRLPLKASLLKTSIEARV